MIVYVTTGVSQAYGDGAASRRMTGMSVVSQKASSQATGHNTANPAERQASILRIHPLWAIGIALAAIVIIVLAIGGYFLGWNWTGFKGNTFWDWMSLLITPVTIAVVSILFSVQQSRQSMAENARMQQEATLEAYFEHITHLLLDGHCWRRRRRVRCAPSPAPARWRPCSR